MAADRIGLPLRLLEGEQHPLPDGERVLEALESRGDALPLVVAEVGMSSAGGDDQIVVGHSAPSVNTTRRRGVDGRYLRQQHFGVGLAPQHRPDRSGDVARIERGGRHLVEHGLKEVVVPAIDQGDSHRRALEAAGGIQSRKAAAEDQDVGHSQPHGLAPPPGEPYDVLQRRDGVLVRIGGVHPPAQVGAVRQRQEGRSSPPAPPREMPTPSAAGPARAAGSEAPATQAGP